MRCAITLWIEPVTLSASLFRSRRVKKTYSQWICVGCLDTKKDGHPSASDPAASAAPIARQLTLTAFLHVRVNKKCFRSHHRVPASELTGACDEDELHFLGYMSLVATFGSSPNQTCTTQISDSMCGANHTQMIATKNKELRTSSGAPERDCTLVCLKDSAKYAVVPWAETNS